MSKKHIFSLSEEEKARQQRMPILEMTEQFCKQNKGYFCIPGHRFERGMNPALEQQYGPGLFRYDLTETDNLDDLHHAEGPILEAQQLSAELFGSDHCYFLVNGTTCGNEAMILAAVKPGEKILVPRNAHKSVTMGLILSGAVPVWIQPEIISEWHTAGPVDPDQIEAVLKENPEIRAVFIVSPTYYGVCSDLKRIAEICHSHQIPLLVDEAHGSHLYFHSAFPMGAIEAGADACAQSTHKTLGSMTQTSMLQIQGNLLRRERIEDSLKMVMSTSPSYVMMAALDAARQQMAVHGPELLEAALRKAAFLKDEASRIPGIRVMRTEPSDPLRAVLSADGLNLSGEQLQTLLYEKGKISLELADPCSIVLVITWGNTEEEIQHLLSTLKKISYMMSEQSAPDKDRQELYSEFPDHAGSEPSGAIPMHSTDIRKYVYSTAPVIACTPREAWYADTVQIPLEEAEGKTAGEMAAPYPPGIPILCPGEKITAEVLKLLKEYRERHIKVHGMEDMTLNTIRVIQV